VQCSGFIKHDVEETAHTLETDRFKCLCPQPCKSFTAAGLWVGDFHLSDPKFPFLQIREIILAALVWFLLLLVIIYLTSSMVLGTQYGNNEDYLVII
jgi:hypothetical protein